VSTVSSLVIIAVILVLGTASRIVFSLVLRRRLSAGYLFLLVIGEVVGVLFLVVFLAFVLFGYR
jgi:hypothetical protein